MCNQSVDPSYNDDTSQGTRSSLTPGITPKSLPINMSSVVQAFVILPLVASGRHHPAYRSTRRKSCRDSKKFNVPIEIYEELQDKSVPSEMYKELQHKSVPIALYQDLQDKLYALSTEWRKDTAAKITEIEKLKV